MSAAALVLLLAAAGAGEPDALAAGDTVRFAIVVGVNEPPEESLPPLRYADDDAARWFDLLRALGAKATVLMTPDADTRRLHPQATGEALPPDDASLREVVTRLAGEVARARDRELTTELYVVYAGHGDIEDGRGYLALHGARLDADRLLDGVVGAVGADRAHVIVDACYSYFLAYERGPGGSVRPLTGFAEMERRASAGSVGMLLSTSTTARSHEWEAFQAGVFSHEVRSGLSGAADADLDGVVTYREIAAFVERANAPIPNPQLRPKVYARAPGSSPALVDLRAALGTGVEVEGERSGRYFMEDARGVRLADFHSAPGRATRIVRSPSAGRVYVRDESRGEEYRVEAGPGLVALSTLAAAPPRAASRGAAHEAFSLLFTTPFTPEAVDAWRPPSDEELAAMVEAVEARPSPWLSPWCLGGGAVTAAGLGGVVAFSAGAFAADGVATDPNAFVTQRSIARVLEQFAVAGAVVSGVVALGGAGACAVPFVIDDASP